MPTHTVTVANFSLTVQQESAIAVAITEAHHVNTGAPAFFAQVLFTTIPAGKHFIGGKRYRTLAYWIDADSRGEDHKGHK